jgi:hypothetical protein
MSGRDMSSAKGGPQPRLAKDGVDSSLRISQITED